MEKNAEAPPPPYEEAMLQNRRLSPREDLRTRGESIRAPAYSLPQPATPLPCVIPQTSKNISGRNFSPFARAYAPGLAGRGISKDDFVAFIDGLNAVFIAHPAFQATKLTSSVFSSLGLPGSAVREEGFGMGSAAATHVTCSVRTNAYMEAMNADFFHPFGLEAQILDTQEMMATIGHAEEALQLPPLMTLGSRTEDVIAHRNSHVGLTSFEVQNDDPRIARLRALQGHILPLDFHNVPATPPADNVLTKMSNARSTRLARKQERKMTRLRSRDERKQAKRARKAQRRETKKSRKTSRKVGKVSRQLAAESVKMGRDLAKKGAQTDPRERQKIINDYERKCEKLQRKLALKSAKWDPAMVDARLGKADKHEHTMAQKIQWVVISSWHGTFEDEVGDLDDDSSSTSSSSSSSDDDKAFSSGKKS